MTTPRFTLVHHHAWVIDKLECRRRTVAVHGVMGRSDSAVIRKLGAFLTDDYKLAKKVAEAVNREGLRGHFSRERVDGMPIYVPDRLPTIEEEGP